MGRLIRYKKAFCFRKLNKFQPKHHLPKILSSEKHRKISYRRENLQNAVERELYNVFYSM